jgi:hypothetical protein
MSTLVIVGKNATLHRQKGYILIRICIYYYC